jgi:hypothetical protein
MPTEASVDSKSKLSSYELNNVVDSIQLINE